MSTPSVEEWRAMGRVFRFQGHAVFLRTGGSGPALLAIHGFPTAGWDWCKVWPELARVRTLVAPDMLGFGLSAKPHRHVYRIAEQADLCLAALSEAGFSSADILAHDYGDTVAQELLARFEAGDCPVRLRSLVLLNGGLFPETHRALLTQRVLRTPLGPLVALLFTRRRLGQVMRKIFGRNAPPSDTEIDAFWELLQRNHGRRALPQLIRYIDERRLERDRWVGALQRTRIPITLVAGVDDPISGAHMIARFRELVPRAAVVELDGVGHYPQIEAPTAVVAATLLALGRSAAVAAEPSPGG